MKFAAKIASDLAKPDGQREVPWGSTRAFLAPLPVWRLWGVGPKTEEHLARLGLKTIGELAKKEPRWLIERLGSGGQHLWELSQGVDSRPVVADREAKSVGAQDTFDEDLNGEEDLAPTLLPSEPLMAADNGNYQRHKKALFRFIDDANIPVDNSATEREFQNVAKLRLNVLFAGNTEGAHRACVLLDIIATCRTVGVPVHAYPTWAYERLGTHRDIFGAPLEEMTPAAFKRTLP